MSKGKRLREQRKAEGPKDTRTINTPEPARVPTPHAARERRHQTRRAFRMWQTLPTPVKRAAEAEAIAMAAENEETK